MFRIRLEPESVFSEKEKQPQSKICPRKRLNPMIIIKPVTRQLIRISAPPGIILNKRQNPATSSIKGTIIARTLMGKDGNTEYP